MAKLYWCLFFLCLPTYFLLALKILQKTESKKPKNQNQKGIRILKLSEWKQEKCHQKLFLASGVLAPFGPPKYFPVYMMHLDPQRSGLNNMHFAQHMYRLPQQLCSSEQRQKCQNYFSRLLKTRYSKMIRINIAIYDSRYSKHNKDIMFYNILWKG